MWRIISFFWLLPALVWADTIDHYMNIANNIPKMEMKADQQSQAWARSARNILILTSESIAESLILANEAAAKAGHPLFCPPQQAKIEANSINELIQKTYKENSSQLTDKNQMTVSQVALLGLQKQYPCKTKAPTGFTREKRIQHVSASASSHGGLSSLGMNG